MYYTYLLATDVLESLKAEHGISDEALARQIGMTTKTVWRIRHGDTPTTRFIAGTEAVFGHVPGLFRLVKVTD